MEKLKKNILKQVAMGVLSKEEAKELLLEIKSDPKDHDNSIAIIGMAARFPDAENYSEYWDNLIHNKVSIKDFPANRIQDSNTNRDKEPICYRKGGYLNSIDGFDAAFFNIAPNEAKFMNPLQRLFLEVSYEAIEDAGYAGDRIYSTKTGVFAGMDHTSKLEYNSKMEADPLSVTGSWTGLLASRVSYILNLKGPSMVIDTACSSGLSAVHIACNAINNGECEMALSGGICLNSIQELKADRLAMLSSEDATVRAFDKYANGTVWGEGAAAVLLKPLSKAIQDKDNIYAVIKGSSMNNNGTATGITALDAKAQEMLYMDAWKRVGINPETISYIETHGTGTVVGDHIEIKGLTNAFKRYTNRKQFCGIGSVKANIGHTVGASGVASFVKVILALNYKKLPATLNFSEPNPYSRFCESPLYITDTNRDWIGMPGCLRRAGVSAFSFNGTNVHIVLEEMDKSNMENNMYFYEIISLSAKSVNAFCQKIKQYKAVLSGERVINLADLAYTTNSGRKHHNVRAAVIFNSKSDLLNKLSLLETALRNDFNNGIFYGESGEEKVNSIIKNRKTVFYNSLFHHVVQGAVKENDLWRILAELGQHYIEGENIDWNSLYAGTERRKISLPTYPFERKRYWILQSGVSDVDTDVISPTAKTKQDIGHESKVTGASCILEEKIGRIYGDILGIYEIDVNDNFYDIGGNSILAINLETKLKYLGYNIDTQALQQYNTVRRLADYIMGQEPQSAAQIKENQGTAHKENETIIKGLIGFNPIFYKYCFYNSLFSIVFKLRGNIDPFLSNDIMVYSLNTSESFNDSIVSYKSAYTVKSLLSRMKINVSASSHHTSEKFIQPEEVKYDFSIANFEKDLGWNCHETDECGRYILKDIKRAVEQKHFILLWVDAYYESMRADTYHKLHLPHVLLLYGFKNDDEYFIAMEHSAKDILSYKKRYVSYEDVYNSYKGFLINFRGSSTIATYHEIYADSKIYSRNQKEHINRYQQNLLINKNEVDKGITDLTKFIQRIYGVMYKDYLSKNTAEDWLEKINSIINGKLVEKYQISNLFGKSYESLELINKNIELWLMVRSIIAKFIFTEKYETNSMSETRKMLKQIASSEEEYYYRKYKR